MDMAVAQARRSAGTTMPNPAVGCIIADRSGQVIARGRTQAGGRPHAEIMAIEAAGARAKGATAYVSLEPCAHHGKTPPCADALIAAGIARVVSAIEDPDPRVKGGGHARLRAAGIAVSVGVRERDAFEVNAGFFSRIMKGRPLLTLKIASSLDGMIATHAGESQWITGEGARAAGHLLRARADAILIGSGTAIADNPDLTCRLPGMEGHSPIRIIADGRLRLPLTSKLVRTAKTVPTMVLTRGDGAEARLEAYVESGVEIVKVPLAPSGLMDMAAAMAILGQDYLFSHVLVEGGARLSSTLMQAGLIDRIAWFRAARLIGGDGRPSLASLGTRSLANTPRFRLITSRQVGEDVLETFEAAS
ncbi:MAG: bifunctional diaminohydroxyphosphoribosylaminopyrimidine deaminase/5-amino-6-(5-phosphoribosylamino)uracil reductase RibD [Alphaproteobacteria bacterium]|nr:bifunctional diaminohydroxyphosphoribosylaminopyrimidine deaminase/5-amino-6-(5-phosphoribosylamino)uracil reductase RibD [Alphaproteobacteria bacterium]